MNERPEPTPSVAEFVACPIDGCDYDTRVGPSVDRARTIVAAHLISSAHRMPYVVARERVCDLPVDPPRRTVYATPPEFIDVGLREAGYEVSPTKPAAQQEASAHDNTEPTDPARLDAVALLRAYLAGDGEGARTIHDYADSGALIDALCAVAITLGMSWTGDREKLDAGLAYWQELWRNRLSASETE